MTVSERCLPVFVGLLQDSDNRVRMEAPEIFRVPCKRRAEFVEPYMEQMQEISETDGNHVVGIHCPGAIRAAEVKGRIGS